MTKRGRTNFGETLLRRENPAVIEGKEQSRTATEGWGVASDANQLVIPATMGGERSVEPKLSRPFRHFSVNSVVMPLDQCSARSPTTTVSGSGSSVTGMPVSETCPWQGMSNEDIAAINDRYNTSAHLNKVGTKSNVANLPEASGSDFPYLVMLDFAQDLSLGKEEVGWSCPITVPIKHGWSLIQCPVLLDSGACVPMPCLITAQASTQLITNMQPA